MDETMKREFFEAYSRVFDEDGIVKPCWTEDAYDLALICEKIDPEHEYWNSITIRSNAVLKLRRNILRKELRQKYDEVFDEDGKIKACGREKCKDLIQVCTMIAPMGIYGDQKTGFLNEEGIKKVKEKYLPKED